MGTLVLKNINKVYPNGVQAVFDFNLEIKDKEFVVFVGPSGCGKSTTLRMIAGLETITYGEFFIDGELMNQVEPKNRNIAMVFQNYALYPHMTVYNNMKFALKLRKVFKPIYVNPEAINELLEEEKQLRKKIKAVEKKFIKDQNNDTLLAERTALYQELYAIEDKKAEVLVQQIGIDEYSIKVHKQTIEKHRKNIAKNKHLIEKYSDRFSEECKALEEENKNSERQVQELLNKIEYLQTHEVPLCKMRKLTKNEMDIEINKIADSIDLARYLFRKPSALSGGQRQRVALGRAIVRKPRVFLMDEPLSNLDAKLRVQTRSEITKIHKKVGATTIYVTHDQVEAMTMADRIVVMKDGYVQQIGTPKELFSDPANKFVASFIGSPAMNFIYGTYSKGVFTAELNDADNVTVGLESFSYKVTKDMQKALKDYEGKRVILGARPEDIYLKGDLNNKHESKPFEITCDYVELLGYDLVIYFYVAGYKVIATTDESSAVISEQKVQLCFDDSKVYFFDAESERRIKKMSVRDFIRENNPKTIRDPNFNGKNLPNSYMTPCSDDTFQNFYYWDTYFINVGLLANNDIEMARNNLKIMEYFANKHGFIPNADHLLYGSQPPLFTRGVYDLYMKTHDINDILYFVNAIEKELNFWEEKRQTEIGLNQYKCAWPDELCKENASYFNNRVNGFNEIELQEGEIEMAKSCYAIAESGMDINSKYYSKGNRFAIKKFACLDLNCLLYDAEKKFAEMLRIIKNDAKAELFEQKAEKRKQLINKYFLKDGLYYDYNFVDKEHSFLLTVASLYPYTFGISSDKEGAKKVFNLLRQKYGLTSTVDFESENKLQWDFPSIWPPFVYFEYIAFKNLNMQEEADFVAKSYKNNVEYNFEKTGKIWEKYNALTNEVSYSFEYQTPTMLGWSAGIYEYFCEEGY